jgi:diaminopimelate epimerase
MLELGISSGEVRVDVPGGTLWVSLVDQQLWLRGSADLVARGKILLPPELL